MTGGQKANLKWQKLAIALVTILAFQFFTLAFLYLDFLLLADRTEHICIVCGQIKSEQRFGIGGRVFQAPQKITTYRVAAWMSPESCRHGWSLLSQKSLYVGDGHSGGISVAYKRRPDVAFLEDEVLVEALWRISLMDPGRASASLTWLIHSQVSGARGGNTKYDSVARSGDADKLVALLLSVPSSE